MIYEFAICVTINASAYRNLFQFYWFFLAVIHDKIACERQTFEYVSVRRWVITYIELESIKIPADWGVCVVYEVLWARAARNWHRWLVWRVRNKWPIWFDQFIASCLHKSNLYSSLAAKCVVIKKKNIRNNQYCVGMSICVAVGNVQGVTYECYGAISYHQYYDIMYFLFACPKNCPNIFRTQIHKYSMALIKKCSLHLIFGTPKIVRIFRTNWIFRFRIKFTSNRRHRSRNVHCTLFFLCPKVVRIIFGIIEYFNFLHAFCFKFCSKTIHHAPHHTQSLVAFNCYATKCN